MTEVDLIKKRLLPNSVRIPLIKTIIEAAVSHCTAWHGMSCHHVVSCLVLCCVVLCYVMLCCVVLCSTVLLDKINYIDSPLCLLYPSHPPVFTSSTCTAYIFISFFILLLFPSLPPYTRTHVLTVRTAEGKHP
jgi:hypothetical protein